MDPDFPNSNQPQPPQQVYQPDQPSVPQATQPTAQPQPPAPADQGSYGGGDFSTGGDDNKTKKLLIIIAALVGLFVIIAIIVLAFSNGGNTPSTETQDQASGDFYVQERSAVDVENVSNSISGDISGLSTDADFPEDKLSDQSLGL